LFTLTKVHFLRTRSPRAIHFAHSTIFIFPKRSGESPAPRGQKV